MKLIEDLIESNELILPSITLIEGGLEAVNVSYASLMCPSSIGSEGIADRQNAAI